MLLSRLTLRTAAFVAVAASLSAAPGCDCSGGEVSVPGKLELVFEYPTEGAVVTSQDDANATAAGIQVNVVARVRGLKSGATLLLMNDQDVDGAGAPVQASAKVADGRVTFSGYTLPEGDVRLRLELEDSPPGLDCSVDEECEEIAIQVVESICFFDGPLPGDTLTADAYPDAANPFDPFETDVALSCRGVSAGDNVALIVNAGRARVAPVDANRRVVFAEVALAEGPNTLQALPRTDAEGNDPQGAPSSATVTVNTGRCTATLLPVDGSRLLAADDLDANASNGMQANIDLVTSCAQTSAVALYVRAPGATTYSQVTPTSVTPLQDAAGIRFRMGGVQLPQSAAPFDVEIVARVDETGGRAGLAVPVAYWVDSSKPSLVSYSPGAGVCLGPIQDSDANASNGIQVDTFGTLVGAENGSEVWVRGYVTGSTVAACASDTECTGGQVCRAQVCRSVATVTSASFIAQAVPLPSGEVTLEYVGLDLAGNQSTPVTATVSVVATVPGVSIAAPADNAVLGVAQDLDTGLPDLQYSVQLSLTNITAGSTGTLVISGQAPITFTPATGTVAVPVALEDGARTLRARIEDTCGNVVETPVVTVTVQSSAPVIGVSAVESGSSPAVSVVDADYTRANAVDLDIVVGAGSTSRSLTVSRTATVDNSGPTRACTGAPTAVSSSTLAASDVGAVVPAAALVEGTNCFVVSVNDGVNPVSATFLVQRRTTAPGVTLTSPVDAASLTLSDDSDANATNGFNYDVLVDLDAANDLDGTVTVELSSVALGGVFASLSQPVVAGGAVAVFGDTSLPAGSYTVTATYRDRLGNVGTSDAASITVTLGAGPQVAISSPASGAYVAPVAGNINVTVVHVGATSSLSCAASVDGGAAQASVPWVTPSSPLVLPVAVTEGARSIRVQCVDGASATGDTQAVVVNVDATAPGAPTLVNEAAGTPGRLVFDVSPSYVNAETADSSAAAGLQHAVTVSVVTGGASPANWVVTLTVTPPGGSPTNYTRTLAGGPDPTLVVFDNVDFGAAEGALAFSATVADAAGNVSTAATASLTIDVTPPVLTQTAPSPAKLVLKREDDQNVDPQFVDLRFTFAVTGVTSGSVELTIDPPPSGKTSADFPMLQAIAGGVAQFPLLAFADGSYFASARVVDAAGNESVADYLFDVAGATAQVEFRLIRSGDVLNIANSDAAPSTAGMQRNFSFGGAGFESGTPLVLCSNVAPPGATTPCRWGRDGGGQPVLGGADAGFAVATGMLTGSMLSSSLTLSAVTVAEGAQLLHAEAREVDGSPDVSTAFLAVTVDSIRPVVSAVAVPSNSTGNDGSGLLRLNGSEGTVAAGKLNAVVRVSVSGLEDARVVSVYSSLSGTGTPVGAGTFSAGAGYADVTVALAQGAQTLTFATSDTAGNTNLASGDTVGSLAVAVDFTPGSATVPAAAFAPYTSAHGTVSGSTLTLGALASIVVSFTDGQPVEGGKIRLERMTAASGGSVVVGSSVEQSVGASQTSATFAGFVLAPGLNYLRAAFTDPAGNEALSAVITYGADFMGPTLTLDVRNASGTSLGACGNFAGACSVDTLAPGGDSRVALDTTASNAYCPPAATLAGECNSAGSALFVQLTGCVNSDASIETCPLTVHLESRVVDVANQGGGSDPRPFDDVNLSPRSMGETGTATLSFADVRFDPGFVREVRMRAVDANGNESVSGSVFVKLWVEGVLITTERLDGSLALTGDLLEDGDDFGIAENTSSVPGTFATNFEVRVASVGAQTPTTVELSVNGGGPVSQPLVSGKATFGGVAFNKMVDPSTPVTNSVIITAKCGASDCGTRQYDGLVADIDAPTYQFDRCSLCALGVPLVDNGLCSTCTAVDANANANMALPASAVAIWNAAGDQDATPGNGFTISGTPLIVKLVATEAGQTVTLSSDQGALSGGSASSSSCPGASCKATFNGLGVPSLSGTGVHRLSVSFTDRAGNAAVPAAVRVDAVRESVYARTDVVAPGGVAPTVCIGESNTPAAIAVPSSDPETYEDPTCTARCVTTGDCSRRGGRATVAWAAPGDDGASGGRVTSYEIGVAPLEIPVPPPSGTTYHACSELTATSTYEQKVSLAATADSGATELLGLDALYPHRAYCFAVIAQDDVGNKAVVGTFARERHLPLVSYPSVLDLQVAPYSDDRTAGAMVVDGTVGTKYGHQMVKVGDMDGDGRDDFAALRRNVGAVRPTVDVYLSSTTPSAADVSIVAPTMMTGSAGVYGLQMGGGDFDGDGDADLAICAQTMTVDPDQDPGTSNSVTSAGALFLYYGNHLDGADGDTLPDGMRRDVNATDAQLPSIFPDVALLGGDKNELCSSVLFANMRGTAADELIVLTGQTSTAARKVLVFNGGSRARFPGSPPTTVKVMVDVAGAAGSATNRADTTFQGTGIVGAVFPWAAAAGDYNGDGYADLAIADTFSTYGVCTDGCGEVFVYRGSLTLAGDIAAPDTSPPTLMARLRHYDTTAGAAENFGQALLAVPAPRAPADTADWLLVRHARLDRVIVFAATSTGTPGFVSTGGSSVESDYTYIDATNWSGATESKFGNEMVLLGDFDGHGGVDIAMAPGPFTTGSQFVSIHSFDSSTSKFVKRMVLTGGADWGTALVAVDSYTAAGAGIELLVSNRSQDAVYLYR